MIRMEIELMTLRNNVLGWWNNLIVRFLGIELYVVLVNDYNGFYNFYCEEFGDLGRL